MEHDYEESNYINYNKFNYSKKQVIQHRHINSDSSVNNKQNKNTQGMASPPSSYSSSPSKNYYDSHKRDESLAYKSSSMDDYQLYQKQKYYNKQNQDLKYQLQKHQEDIQKSLQYCQQQQHYASTPRREMMESPVMKIEKTMKSEPTLNKQSELSKMIPRDPRGDITTSMGNLTLGERKQDTLSPNYGSKSGVHKHRKMKSSSDMHIYDNQVKKSLHKRINSNENYNEEEIISDNDSRRDLILKDSGSNGKKQNRYKYSEKQPYNSPSMGQAQIPVSQNPNYNKFNDEGLDISVGEILTHGLKAMIKSKVPLCYFLHTLIEDYCCENLFFYLEIEQYKVFMFESAKAQLKAAQYIYITYLDASSKIEVNIDEKIRREILNQLNSKTCNLPAVFDKASEAVFALMESSYAKFNRSDIKRQMIDELDNTNIYSEEHKINAIRLLTSYLDKRKRELEVDEEIMNMNAENNPMPGDMGISPEQMLHYSNVQRHKLIYALTHEFIRAFLELDFDDESVPGEVCVFRPPIQYIQNINEDPLKHLSSSPTSKRIMQDVQITINTDSQGQQYQMITTPPIPIASFRLDNYGSLNSSISRSSNNKNNSANPFKKFMKSVKLMN
ncbi:hypothetical protein H8356DRAFT_1077311 [Neocallimastix lanati (nom. inval.)]|jgi:hypothetical protein|nr:hypothetical protein H8356DRAFT_1077311 [Neocallimastix sp. JGI-2020a]